VASTFERYTNAAKPVVTDCCRSIRLLHTLRLQTTRSAQMVILLVTLLSAATAQLVSSDHTGIKATFATSNGRVIELNTRTGTLVYTTLKRYWAPRLQ
jgi:hypothetical protein